MKAILHFISLFSLVAILSTAAVSEATAQCAMCSLNAENSTQHGNTQGKGLNNGILFLLGVPFVVGGGVVILWYKKYRTNAEKPAPFL
ncbi:hypothetical protein ACL9RF_16360 [Sphingobacterium sp. Mn56C]|uniref:hypothetical protein n=1 Tax=Sphingobacterium sp. Mn56C TaxID=3395261 RepID=UPI003BE2ECCB